MPIAQGRLEVLQICKLLQCVREEDKDQIKKMTQNGVPHLINYNEPENGETALSVAAVQNNEDMINFLIELGAHPDVVDMKGRSPAMRAAEFGHVQCLECLTDKAHADMKLVDLEGKCIIHYCLLATQRHEACLKIVLAKGADVNTKANDGKPVFQSACEQGPDIEEMALMLLKKGADPNGLHEKTQRTALMAAAASGCHKIAREIMELGGEIDVQDKLKTHAAHEAAKGGFFEVLVALAAYGARFDVIDNKGNTPLHFAAKNGFGPCCKFIGQRGCNPKIKNGEGDLAKVLAKEGSHKEAGKELRKVEKAFGKPGKNNEPSSIKLYDFVYARQEQCLRTFRKVDVDSLGTLPKDEFIDCLQNMGAPMPPEKDMDKIIGLHDKSREPVINYEEFIASKKYINKLYLMSAFEGKKKKKKGKGGKKKKGKTKVLMPICYQNDGPRNVDGGPPEVFIEQHIHFTDNNRFNRDEPPTHPLQDDSAWYLAHPEKRYLNINDSTRNGDIDSLREAFSKGTPVDTRDKYYKTPLMIACSLGNLRVAKFLVESGANINAKDNFKWTALHHACHSGMVDLVEYLVDHGAELDATTMNGGTPLMRAVESSKLDVVQYLINKNCKMQVENRKGQNPCDLAMAWADPRVYEAVRLKWDTLAPPPDKKKKGAKGGKKGPKRPGTKPPGSAGSPNKSPSASRQMSGYESAMSI
ncbi:unnamed protein product [Owenia fusiformis]|uniref:Uncharacterized protein n=1 Tax=Owenia fusiformis TaxID=6347 RepID=A0A8J1Y4V3_OWEFU|nr:unnamed protein product [Owenia fusiformis]